MIVHIVRDEHPLCGFTNDPPRHWPVEHKCVDPEEAHFCNCYLCISRLHDDDERQARAEGLTLRGCP